MRRPLDVLLVLAVLAVAAAAALDAFDGRAQSDAAAPGDDVREAAAALRSLGASGRLLVSDDSCRRFFVRLPSLERTEIPRITGCRVFGQRGNLGIRDGEVAWYAFPGGATPVLTRTQLRHALAGSVTGADVAVRRAAWLGRMRFAALASPGALDAAVVAIFERGRLVRAPLTIAGGAAELRTSRSFGYAAVVSASGRLVVLDRDGAPIPLPELADVRSVAWSADERLTAVARTDGIVVFPSGETNGPSALIPLSVRDLDWAP